MSILLLIIFYGKMSKMRKNSSFYLLYLIIIIIFASCGLYSYVSLNPPISFDDKGSNLLELHHDLNNNDGSDQEFLGYEIYYRAYSDFNIAKGDDELLATANSNYLGNPDGFINYAKNLGFLRLRRKTNDSADNPPLLAITDTSPEVYYIELTTLGEWILSPTYQSDTTDNIELVRSIISDYATRSSLTSATNYYQGDIDYEGESSPTTVYFVFFAVAFGTDTASFSSIYSEARVIGTPIQYNPLN
jgi:hypothetical protein